MYLSRLYLQNWRSYADAVFEFKAPSVWRSAVFRGTGDLTLVACNGGEHTGLRK
jgi:hypothetical protein